MNEPISEEEIRAILGREITVNMHTSLDDLMAQAFLVGARWALVGREPEVKNA